MPEGQISPDYASPNLRWALLLEDFPGATYDFAMRSGTDLGVPSDWGGDEDFCVATITFPESTGLAPVIAYKAVAEALITDRWVQQGSKRVKQKVELPRTPELWNKLCTMTLGRALKRSGYPDDMPELKALVAWRKRHAEVQALVATIGAPPALGAGQEDVPELDQAAVADPEHTGLEDDGSLPDIEVESEEVSPEQAAGDDPGDDPVANSVLQLAAAEERRKTIAAALDIDHDEAEGIWICGYLPCSTLGTEMSWTSLLATADHVRTAHPDAYADVARAIRGNGG